MTSETYAHQIAKRFSNSISEYDDILLMMTKLIRLSKSEIEPSAPDEKVNGLKGLLSDSIEGTIKAISETNKNDLDKVSLIISYLKMNGKEYHISIIPEDLFNTFWNFAENKKMNIVFDDDYQNFKVL